MNYRIFITGSGIAKEALNLLDKHDCVIETGHPHDTFEVLKRKILTFSPDAIIVRQGSINAEIIDNAPNLKVICKHGTGTDNIDINSATLKYIPVLYTPGTNSESVAEHTLSLILALSRKIVIEDKKLKNGIFDKRDYNGIELYKKTLGIIGFGIIGNRLSALVEPFHMKILFFDPFFEGKISSKNIQRCDDVDTLSKESDFISIHCESTPTTVDMINEKFINQMKNTAYIINTARGNIINQIDLLKALKSKTIAGAAIDVFIKEPPDLNSKLFQMDNLIVTPHIAGMSDKSYVDMGKLSALNVLNILNNHPIDTKYIKNPNVLNS